MHAETHISASIHTCIPHTTPSTHTPLHTTTITSYSTHHTTTHISHTLHTPQHMHPQYTHAHSTQHTHTHPPPALPDTKLDFQQSQMISLPERRRRRKPSELPQITNSQAALAPPEPGTLFDGTQAELMLCLFSDGFDLYLFLWFSS